MASTSESASGEHVNSSIVEQFCLVTGENNNDRARKMLEVCNWNLEMAVNMHVDSDCQQSSVDPDVGTNTEDVRAPIPQSRNILIEEDLQSFHYGLRSKKRRAHSVFDGFRDFRAEAEFEQSADRNSVENLKKRKTLEDLFRPPLDLIFRGNFESARDFGQKRNRWLMVNLQDAQEFACQVLNRDVWSSECVKRMVRENFIFWQVYIDSLDGERFMQFYKPAQFPYIAILDPRTGEKLVVWNNVDAISLCDLMKNFLSSRSSPDGSSTEFSSVESRFSLLDQSEEEQLKAALAASVKENTNTDIDDNDSDLETFDSDSNGPMEKASSTTTTLVHSDHSNDVIDVVGLTENSEKVLEASESWKDYLGNDKDPKSDLVLRLPDGKKEQISWPCSTKVKCLLLYIGEIGYDPQKFELVTNFPRRNLCQLDMSKSLKEVDLFPREMIYIQLKS